jgi:hypothetical protein
MLGKKHIELIANTQFGKVIMCVFPAFHFGLSSPIIFLAALASVANYLNKIQLAL